MIINIKNEDYQELISLCVKSRLEENGVIRLEIVNDELHFLDYHVSSGKEIIKRTKDSIVYNTEDYIYYQMMTTLFFDPSKQIWVDYHTHPGLLSLNILSESDIEVLKYRTYLRNKVYKEVFKIDPPIQIDAIITEDDVAFYSIIDDKIVKHDVLVDKREIIETGSYTKILKRVVNRIIK